MRESPWSAWTGPSAIPIDIKSDIARVARSISFAGADATCVWRALLGRRALQRLGWAPNLRIGGLLYRGGAGPSDMVSYCRGNYGEADGETYFGHVWLSLHGEIVDFSCADWHYASASGDLGERWRCQPPSFVWADARLFKWSAEGRPEVGEAWYCPWRGAPPTFLRDLDAMDADTGQFDAVIENNIGVARLRERVDAKRALFTSSMM
jgi:hypothetical protein